MDNLLTIQEISRRSGVAALLHIGENALDNAACLGVRLLLLAGERCGLDMPGHRINSCGRMWRRSLAARRGDEKAAG